MSLLGCSGQDKQGSRILCVRLKVRPAEARSGGAEHGFASLYRPTIGFIAMIAVRITRRTEDPVNESGRTLHFSLKPQLFMFISPHLKLKGVLLDENFTREPMEPLIEPRSIV